MQAYWTLDTPRTGGLLPVPDRLCHHRGRPVPDGQQLRGDVGETPIRADHGAGHRKVFYNTEFFWLILLPTTPLITMRLFAQEKFSGTFETLMTSPVKDLEVVLAKFTAALMFYAVMWLPMLGCLLVVRHYAHDASALDAGVVASTFLGILLLGAMFVALGCFASSLTRNQAVAAMISLVFDVSLFLLAYLADRFADGAQWQAQVLACFTLFDQMPDFARGVVDTRAVVLYLSLALFFLFLTLRVVESRRWK